MVLRLLVSQHFIVRMPKQEKFIMAGDCALRISDSGTPKKRVPKDVANTDNGVAPAAAVSATDGVVPTVVLLHGYMESLDIWDEFTDLLSPHIRVVAVDLPGHGVSEVKSEVHTMGFLADTVVAALQVIGVNRAVVVGHSMGGYVALEMLAHYPQLVAGIVMFHSAPDADSDDKRRDRLREMDIIRSGRKEFIARNFSSAGFAPHNRDRLQWAVEELAEQIMLTEDEGILAILAGMSARHDHSQLLQQSTVPQLFIFGRHDSYISPEAAETVVAAHPQASYLWLENSAHMGFIEEPETSAHAILEFVNKSFV